jgi:hypothetical protein
MLATPNLLSATEKRDDFFLKIKIKNEAFTNFHFEFERGRLK